MSATRFGTRWSFRGGGAASRATVTMVDQCVASASNFSVAIVVARITGPAGLGAFALAYTVWILATTLHRAMITDPMAIMGDIRGKERDQYIRRGFAADVILGAMAACIIAALGTVFLAAGQHTFGIGLLSVAPWIVVLDLQDYWRWIGFMMGKPRKSLMNDLLFIAVQALAFGAVVVLGLHSVFAVVSAWGLGAAVAAAYGLRQFSVRPSIRGGIAFLWSRWPTSRWLASERGASWGALQLYLFVAGAILGPAALGGIKAAQGLVLGPTTLVLNAGGSFGLPEATRQLAERGWAGMIRVTRFVTTAGVSVSAVCAIAVLFAAPDLSEGSLRSRIRAVRSVRSTLRHLDRRYGVRRRAGLDADRDRTDRSAFHRSACSDGLHGGADISLCQGERSDRGSDGESLGMCRDPGCHVGYSVPGTPVGRGDPAHAWDADRGGWGQGEKAPLRLGGGVGESGRGRGGNNRRSSSSWWRTD